MSAAKLALTIYLCLTCLLSGNLPAARASGSFVYAVPTAEQAGKFRGQVNIDRIDRLLLPRGLAAFSDDELTFSAVPEWLFDRNPVLKGVIIRAEGVSEKSGVLLGGLAVMLEGQWLGSLARAGAPEALDTIDGAHWRGRIRGRNGAALTFEHADGRKEDIAFSRIKTIDSARAFTFNITTDNVRVNPTDSSMSFEARQLLLKPCHARHTLFAGGRLPQSNLAGSEPGITRTAIATFVGLDMLSTIAAPVAIPLVLNAANQRAAKNKIAQVEFANFLQSLSGSSSASSTAVSAGITRP
jgi:hypothetical protein